MKNQPEALAMEGVRFFGEMSASISHEIKNVLAIVNENAGLLADLVRMSEKGIPLNPERLSRVAASIAGQVDRGDRIVKSMNRFAHSADLPREPVDLGDVVTFIPELAARLITMRGTPLHVELAAAPIVVETNRFFLENLVWACLCQALQASQPPQTVTLSAKADSGRAIIRFSGLHATHLSEKPEIPDERQALVAGLLGASVKVDASAGTLDIVFVKPA
jgi:C4-dicarboxylate-specific signal transduction histidine kinase